MKIYEYLSIRWILILILSFFLYNSYKENEKYEKENISSNDKIKELNLIVENLNLNFIIILYILDILTTIIIFLT